MNKNYINGSIVVKNEKNFIYKTRCYYSYEYKDYIVWELELIAGWDYLSEDSDIQGYILADKFSDDIQQQEVIQYFLKEGLEEALKENEYEILTQNQINKLRENYGIEV